MYHIFGTIFADMRCDTVLGSAGFRRNRARSIYTTRGPQLKVHLNK